MTMTTLNKDKTFFEVNIEGTTNEDTNTLESLFFQSVRALLSVEDTTVEEPCDFLEYLSLIPNDIEIDYGGE